MPWIARPFDYYGTAPDQVLEDLTQANDNFEILGNCFVNNDPTTGIAKNASYADNADKVDGFHASQTPSANTIPVAGANGKLDSGWINISINATTTPTPNAIPQADANGKLNDGWLSNIPYVRAIMSANQVLDTAFMWYKIAFNKIVQGSNFDTTNYRYVVPITGLYVVMASIYMDGSDVDKYIAIRINENTEVNRAYTTVNINLWTQAILFLNAGDTISIYGYRGSGQDITVYADRSWFQVFRLR
jgi:hypothetical protein